MCRVADEMEDGSVKFVFENTEFTFEGEHCPEISMSLVENSDGLSVYMLSFDWEKPTTPIPVTLRFRSPCCDAYTHMKPDLYRMHNVPWGTAKELESRLGKWMPIMQFVSKCEINKRTIALADVKSHIKMNSYVVLPGFYTGTEIAFFISPSNPISHYETYLRIDEREIAYHTALSDAMAWYAGLGYRNDYVPASAYDSVYSTWYAYLQEISAKEILQECRLAKKAGMDTLIVDDGWQNEGVVRDYSGCGDWKPAKNRFPNMKKFVDEVHRIGMKVMLWFSVPFIGYDAENYKRFEDKFLHKLDGSRCAVLDPRYKQVRAFLVDTYADAVRNWGLDGLKLDFIDRFAFNGEVNDAMDIASVEDAVEQLLREINTALRAIKEDILIEFRQPYMGPVITTYGNMIRVWDCPLDPIVNRVGITDLRMLTGNCAVHSDMIYWDNRDCAQSVATHLYSAIFSVPQISVRMAELTTEHKMVLKEFLRFRRANLDVLMQGSFVAKGIHANYAHTEAALGNKRVSLCTDTAVLALDASYTQDCLINLTGKDEIIIVGDKENVKYEIFDCMGRRICRPRKLKKTQTCIGVPHAGRIHFLRENKGEEV